MATRPKFIDLVRSAVARGGSGDVLIERDMEVTEPVLVFDIAGLRIRGKDGRRPVLYWTGEADTMIDCANVGDSLMENFCVEIHGELGNAFHYWRQVKGRTTPTNNKHRGIACLVRPGGSLYRFTSHDPYTDTEQPLGIDENNEFSLYEDIDVNGALDGIRFLGQQSHGHVLTRCRLNVTNNAVVSSGWFSATDVSGSGVQTAFAIAGISAPIHIVRPNFEATKRLLDAGDGSESGFTGDSQPILIEGGSTRCDQLHPDGAIIDLKTAGPLRVIGHQFGSGKQPVPHIRTWSQGNVTVESCDIGSWNSYGKPFIRRPDGSQDMESMMVRTWLHRASGEPVRSPRW